MDKFFKAMAITLFIVVANSCSNDSDLDSMNDPSRNNKKSTGSSANDFLSENKFKSLVIELIYVQDFRPSQKAIDNLIGFMEERTFKPQGIRVVERAIPSPGKSPYTVQEVADIEDINRQIYNSNNEIALSILVLDGNSDQDKDNSVVLGTAYRNTSFVIFENTLRNSSDNPGEPNRIVLESTVLNHEFSHLLGLVNFGTPMLQDHQDEPNGKHCDVEDCLMNYKAEAGGILQMTTGGAIPALDAQCIADLRANGGK